MGATPPGQTRAEVCDFVQGRILEGRSPTVREVQEAMGFRSIRTAQYHLERLVTEGRLKCVKGQARGYRLSHEGCHGPISIDLRDVDGETSVNVRLETPGGSMVYLFSQAFPGNQQVYVSDQRKTGERTDPSPG